MRRPILWMAVTALLCVSSIRADIVYNFGDTFSGTSPAGTAPWLTATFHTVSTGTVTLTLNSQLQSSTEFISDVYFNTNPAGLVPASLAFAQNSGVSFSGATLGEDCCKADGDGYYDIEIDFPTSQGSRFGQGSSAVFTFTGTGITEDYFDFLSSPGGGSTPPRTLPLFRSRPAWCSC